ncbi:MAG: tRNA-dihydrouridine synthase family protein [Treponema sp.]|nr:tRNA-dihydrouridine synthase family protein [Treponema sp.]MEE3435498.1 tRNA-dihydrouridine synthase family protein [Treponema sp.]
MTQLIAGPMATLSHEAFRRLVEKFGGPDEYYTEMINAPTLLQKGPFEKYYLMNGPVPQKIVWQLTSKEAASMAAAVEVLAPLGGIGIDINMGCSAPEIVHSGAGIAWMLKPQEETLSMVKGVKRAIEKTVPAYRLSAKIRLGADNFSEEKFYDFCKGLCDSGVQRIVLHPRAQREKLSRPPRRYYAQRLAALLKPRGVEVVYNGNVKDSASAAAAMADCPDCSGLMISRAAVQKPWIFAQLRGDFCGGVDLMQTGLDYIALLQEFQPPEFFKSRMQRFFSYYCDNFAFGHYIKMKMLNAATPQEAEETFRSYFDEQPDDRFKALQ